VLALLLGVGVGVAGLVGPAGALVGTAAALLVARLGRPLVDRLVRVAERVTDPVLALVWRFAPATD